MNYFWECYGDIFFFKQSTCILYIHKVLCLQLLRLCICKDPFMYYIFYVTISRKQIVSILLLCLSRANYYIDIQFFIHEDKLKYTRIVLVMFINKYTIYLYNYDNTNIHVVFFHYAVNHNYDDLLLIII